MQKTCKRESYALSTGGELSFVLLKKRVPIIKKPIMITLLKEISIKKRRRNSDYSPSVVTGSTERE